MPIGKKISQLENPIGNFSSPVQSSEPLTNALDAKCEKADLDDVTSTIENSNRLEQKQLN